MSDFEVNLPDQKELEKEIGEYLTRKYGRRVKIVSSMLPLASAPEGEEPKGGGADQDRFRFDTTPEELIAYLDQYLVKQDQAKAILATKICTHFNRISREGEQGGGGRRIGRIKNNVLLIGPTGVGKTFLVRLIADKLGVPFVKGDATKFSETGYVGGDVEDLVRDLVRQADGDLERAQYGIIYVDEIDKIAASEHRFGADVSRTGVQRALLKPMEETEVELKVPHDPISQIEAIEQYRATGKREKRVVNTRNILFIMSGAFSGLEEIIRQRLQQQSIGFGRPVGPAKAGSRFLREVKAEDLIRYGFESEFVGRLPVVAVLEELGVEDYHQILRNPNSPVVVAKKQDFRAYGIHLQFEDQALLEIARLAEQERTGARGLVSVMERVLLQYERSLPSTSIRHLVVTTAMVADPLAELDRLLAEPTRGEWHRRRHQELEEDACQRIEKFILASLGDDLEARGMVVTPVRLSLMAREALVEDRDPREVCDGFVSLLEAVAARAAEMSEKCGVQVEFADEALDRLLARQPRDPETIAQACDELLAAMEYGLLLLSQKKGMERVVITAQGVDAPERFVNNLVGKAFQVE